MSASRRDSRCGIMSARVVAGSRLRSRIPSARCVACGMCTSARADVHSFRCSARPHWRLPVGDKGWTTLIADRQRESVARSVAEAATKPPRELFDSLPKPPPRTRAAAKRARVWPEPGPLWIREGNRLIVTLAVETKNEGNLKSPHTPYLLQSYREKVHRTVGLALLACP